MRLHHPAHPWLGGTPFKFKFKFKAQETPLDYKELRLAVP